MSATIRVTMCSAMLCVCSLCCSHAILAQSSNSSAPAAKPLAALTAASQSDPAVPQVVDPLLVKPVSELTPEQIEGMQKRLLDWPNLHQFREEDDRLPPEPVQRTTTLPQPLAKRVIFFGDSITIAWKERDGNQFFPGKPYVNRGISGQTTPQMLVRFQQDVVALHPSVVVILAGINDIAGNTGPSTLPMIEDNFKSMVAVAHANLIAVVLSSVLPSTSLAWRGGYNPSQQIVQLNQWLKWYAAATRCTYLDYYSALVDDKGGMKPGLSKDGVHPTPAGYAIMAPLAQAAIDQTIRNIRLQ